jgi:hypothetical protein
MKCFAVFVLACLAVAVNSVEASSGRFLSANATVDEKIAALAADFDDKLTDMAASNDRAWMMSSAFTILEMQAGFAMLEVSLESR